MATERDRRGFDPAAEGARGAARSIELRLRRQEALDARRRRPDLDLLLPARFVDADTGRKELSVSPTVALAGEYLRRSRLLAGMTQTQLARASGVSQPMISRVERGRAPAMPFERIVALCVALDRLFPFGACPHDHGCPWQPYRPINHEITDASRFIDELLKYSDERMQDTPDDAFDATTAIHPARTANRNE